jgi:hypothetical protein
MAKGLKYDQNKDFEMWIILECPGDMGQHRNRRNETMCYDQNR